MPKKLKSHWLLFILIFVLVLLAALPVLTYPMGRDQGMYANIGRSIVYGGTPYVDMWDIKPPPIYYIYAAGIKLFGTTTRAIRAIDFTLIPFGMLGLYLLGTRIAHRRLGLLSALIYGVFYFNEDFQNLTQSDSLVTVLLIWAAHTAFRSAKSESNSRQGWLFALLTGAISGVILYFKQYYAFFVLALVLNQVTARLNPTPKSPPQSIREGTSNADGQTERTNAIVHAPTQSQVENVGSAQWHSPMQKYVGLLKESLAFAIGGLLTGGAILLYFWSQGMIGEMLIVAEGTAAYNAQGYDFGAFIANMGNYLYFRWLTWHVLLVLTGIWIVIQIIGWVSHPTPKSPPQSIREGTSNADAIHHVPTGEGETGTKSNGSAQGIARDDEDEYHGSSAQWHASTDNGWRLIVFWLIATLAFALIQAKGFDTHWIPMLPAMALMAADALDKLVQFIVFRKTDAIHHIPTDGEKKEASIQDKTSSLPVNGKGRGGVKNKVAIALYMLSVIGLLSITSMTTWGRAWGYLTGQETQIAYWDTFQANDLKAEQSLEVANFLRARVLAGDSLFIWGFRPEVYFMTELWPATRYQAHFPLVAPWYPQEWKQNNVDILWAAMPPYVLVLEDDFMPWVTDFDADSHTLLQDYTELNNWLIANYERETQIGDFIIWRQSGQ